MPEFCCHEIFGKITHLVSVAEIASRALTTVPTTHSDVATDGVCSARVFKALVDVNTGRVVVVELGALLTLALEAANGVLAHFHITTWGREAFVNIDTFVFFIKLQTGWTDTVVASL